MRNILLISIFAVLISSCEFETENIQGSKDSVTKETKKDSLENFKGKPDLPSDEYQITTGGIDKVKLGDSLNSVHAFYTTVKDIKVNRREYEWNGKKIILDNNSWIIAESVNSVNQITSIRTNNPSYLTSSGIHVEMKLDSIMMKNDSIVVNEKEKSFLLYRQGVLFKVDSKSESKIFKKNCEIQFLKDAIIKELFIVCGDC
jgi:hypothetical protein